MGTPTILYCQYGTTAASVASLTGNGKGAEVLSATEDLFYSPLDTTAFNIVIDFGVATSFDSFGILGANMEGATVEVRGSTDNFGASDVSVSAGAVVSSDVNSTWRQFTEVSFRYAKLLFSGHPSILRVANICLSVAPDMPFFETDPDIDSLKPTAKHLLSQSGIYNGNNQQRSMREMELNWGEVTPTELIPINDFANACIKVTRPFFFVPDVEENESFFCWIPGGGDFKTPETPGVSTVSAFTVTTRAD